MIPVNLRWLKMTEEATTKKTSVEKIIVNDGKVTGVKVNGSIMHSDIVLSGADYHHTETLLDLKDRVNKE